MERIKDGSQLLKTLLFEQMKLFIVSFSFFLRKHPLLYFKPTSGSGFTFRTLVEFSIPYFFLFFIVFHCLALALFQFFSGLERKKPFFQLVTITITKQRYSKIEAGVIEPEDGREREREGELRV